MAKGKFGAENYRPLGLGPEPTEPVPPAVVLASVEAAPQDPVSSVDELKALRSLKIPFSSRITVSAEKQLKMLARRGEHSQTELLADALNLLFRKYGLDELA